MGMVVRTNTQAMNAGRQLGMNSNAVSKSLEKLSSGLRINRAGDDASGLAISEKMKAQIKGLEQASANSQDGISLIQTAEGATTEIHNMLNRMVELATKSANGTIQNEVDREAIATEVQALNTEITRISKATNFNGINLLDGSLGDKAIDTLLADSGAANIADGVTINAPVDGAGKKQEYEIKFGDKDLFGTGDKIAINFTDTSKVSTDPAAKVKLEYEFDATAATPASGKFGGATQKEQLANVTKLMNADAKINTAYEAKLNEAGNGIILTAKAEGVATITLDNDAVSFTDKQMNAVATLKTPGADRVLADTTLIAAKDNGVSDLFGGKGAKDLAEGDKLVFTFNVNGKDQTVTLGVGKDGPIKVGETTAATTKAIADALNAASFDDQVGTGIRESELKVSDYFTVAENENCYGQANEGGLQITQKSGQESATNILSKVDLNYLDDTKTDYTKTADKTEGAVRDGKFAASVAGTAGSVTAASGITGSAKTIIDKFDIQGSNSAALVGATALDGKELSFETDQNVTATIKFVTAASKTGAANEVEVTDSIKGSELLTAVNSALSAVADADYETAQKTTLTGANATKTKITMVGSATGFANGTTDVTTQAYTENGTSAAAKNQVSNVALTEDFAVGDSITLRGQLSDGRSFEFKLEAVSKDTAAGDLKANQFKLGATTSETRDNVFAALTATGNKMRLTDGAGKSEDVDASSVIGAGKEFTVAKTDDAASPAVTTGFTLTSVGAGIAKKGVAAKLDNVERKVADELSATSKATVTGKGQTKSENIMTFDPSKVEQGTTVKIDGKNYEFVTNAKFLSNAKNTAVIIETLGKRDEKGELTADAATGHDISSALLKTVANKNYTGAAGAPIAQPDGSYKDSTGAVVDKDNNLLDSAGKTFASKLNATTGELEGQFVSAENKDANGVDHGSIEYRLSVDAGSGAMKITSLSTGTAAKPIGDIEVTTKSRETASIKFATKDVGTKTNPKSDITIKVGDKLTINGKTYEFTDGKRTSEEGNVAVNVDGLSKTETRPSIDDAMNALANAINTADGDKTIAMVNKKTGSVDLTSKFDGDKATGKEYSAPTVKLAESGEGLTLQIGDTNDDFNHVTVKVDDLSAAGIGTDKVDVSNQKGAGAAIDTIRSAINKVSTNRANMGALQNRLEYTINNLDTTAENMTAANSRIRDTDMAKEMMKYTQMNVLTQAAQAMLAQANQQPQAILQLLG